MFDLIVIGGGPVGLYSAKLCETLGLKVIVLEADEKIGEPLQCSGLVSKNIDRFFPDIKRWGVVEHEVNSAVIHSKKSRLLLKKSSTAAYVINRSEFDRKLSKMLKSEVKTNCRAKTMVFKKDCVVVDTTLGEFEGRVVLGCDGPVLRSW